MLFFFARLTVRKIALRIVRKNRWDGGGALSELFAEEMVEFQVSMINGCEAFISISVSNPYSLNPDPDPSYFLTLSENNLKIIS